MNPDIDINKQFPEIEIAGEFYCPHCGHRIFSWEDSYVSKCPHLIYAYGWNEHDMFLAVRVDFAKSFRRALLDSSVYHEFLTENEMAPITKQDWEMFCRADFGPEDKVAYIIAAYCSDLPERIFPEIFSRSTVIFKDDRYHSGVHIALDLGIIE